MSGEDTHFSEQFNQSASPFENFFHSQENNTDMFYEAVPYVSMQFKKPLALFLKMQELQQILSGFDNMETLQACGLCENTQSSNSQTNSWSNTSLENMIQAMRKKAPSSISGKLDLILTIFKAEKILSAYQKYAATQNLSAQENNNNNNDLFSQILPLLLTNTNTSQTDLVHLAEQIQNAAKGADYEPKLAN